MTEFRCPQAHHHHVGDYCPVCGNDERQIGAHLPVNPDWPGYSMPEFVSRWGITLDTSRMQFRIGEWLRGQRHFLCRFRRAHPVGAFHGLLVCAYTTGPNGREPSAADVLEHLRLEVLTAHEHQSFGPWCRAYGYDPSAAHSQTVYTTITLQRERLRTFLGPVGYGEFVDDVRR